MPVQQRIFFVSACCVLINLHYTEITFAYTKLHNKNEATVLTR